MKKELKIKVCGMRDPENIQGVLKALPDFLGYIFYPKSKRFIGNQPDAVIFDTVPRSTQKVGVFVNEDIKQVISLCREYNLQVAQLHGNESPEYCQDVSNEKITVFKAFSLNEEFDFSVLPSYSKCVDYFLFDTKGKLPGGTGLKFNWEILDQYQLEVPFFLSGGIGPDDVTAIKKLNHSQLFGLDINSGFEVEPALKDVEAVRKFIQEIRN
ncbi:phosphoribosylanthranilate isomerase [Sunxiuqinia sp. A32]|uniref:phosphoribosylanthranilate isomerase n=1 Tax=Sunxiuqinia sp. A32 TaxID=3461496 RepID=UPI0040464543